MGGEVTLIQKYPFIVQVEFLSQVSDIWTQNCAGSILNSIYVLSAAQCFSGWYVLCVQKLCVFLKTFILVPADLPLNVE